jgi:hypothetical protein
MLCQKCGWYNNGKSKRLWKRGMCVESDMTQKNLFQKLKTVNVNVKKNVEKGFKCG